MRAFAAATVLTTALVLGGCGGADAPTVAPPGPTTGPPAGPAATEPVSDPVGTPGPEVCEVEPEWAKVDAFLVKANRESPPAPSYNLAAQHLEGTIPPSSIEPRWKELKDRVRAYAEVLSFGSDAEVAAQADEVTAISRLHLALFGVFQQFC